MVWGTYLEKNCPSSNGHLLVVFFLCILDRRRLSMEWNGIEWNGIYSQSGNSTKCMHNLTILIIMSMINDLWFYVSVVIISLPNYDGSPCPRFLVQEIWNLKCENSSRIIHARKGGVKLQWKTNIGIHVEVGLTEPGEQFRKWKDIFLIIAITPLPSQFDLPPQPPAPHN